MDLPTNVYPLFAQALRKEQKKTADEHLRDCAYLFSKFSKIAADNPYSWFQTYRSPEDISEVSQSNRYIYELRAPINVPLKFYKFEQI